MNDFWNERYNAKEYIYGITPNKFVEQELKKLKPGKILFPAEGEGRNAVFAATLGWEVVAFDPSKEGRKKAEKLARNNGVEIDYRLVGYVDAEFNENEFDALVLVFAHMPAQKRSEYHRKLLSFVKPGGKIIFEGFSKNQIKKNTGGPRNLDMLFSIHELKSDFNLLKEIIVNEEEKTINEGNFHRGVVSVINIVGTK